MFTKLFNPVAPWVCPKNFYQRSPRLIRMAIVLTLVSLSYGVVGALWLAPADYQQGDAFRLIYLHVPSAFLSLMVYAVMAVGSVISLIWQVKLADVIVRVAAPMGAWMTLLALITGSLWGKPMWGTWWIWDARLTSEFILLVLYLGIIAFSQAAGRSTQAAKVVAILVLVGSIDLPIIHYSVQWWQTLHQGATLSRLGKPSMAPSMLYPLLAMILAFVSYNFIVIVQRARTEILWRDRKANWVKLLMTGGYPCH